MYLEKTLKNSAISVFAHVFMMLMQFINRAIFVIFLNVEYLGYQSAFGAIFSVLSVTELGFGNLISFHLYRELVAKNTHEIGKFMYLCKWVYRMISLVILVLGLAICAFVPYMVKGSTLGVEYLYAVYFLQLFSTVVGYLVAYRRTIFAADQKDYKNAQVDLVVNVVLQVIQLILLAIFKNYLIYLAIQVWIMVVSNSVIYFKTNRAYPYLKEKYTFTKEDLRKWNIIPDVKNGIVHRISNAVYESTNNIVISALIGVRDVALYGNYLLIRSGVVHLFFMRLLNPVQAAIGNILYEKRDKDVLWKQFEILDIFSFFFASILAAGLIVFLQPLMILWMGPENLLSNAFVLVFTLTIYLTAVWEIVYKYRMAFGDYRQDRNCMIAGAILHIVLSVVLSGPFGVTGVVIGDFFGFLPMAYGRIRFVVKRYFKHSLRQYLFKHFCLLLIAIAECVLLFFLTSTLPLSIGGIALRILYWVVIPLGINLLLYWRDPNFKELLGYLKRIRGIVRSRNPLRKKSSD